MKSKPSPLMVFLFAHRSEKLVTCVVAWMPSRPAESATRAQAGHRCAFRTHETLCTRRFEDAPGGDDSSSSPPGDPRSFPARANALSRARASPARVGCRGARSRASQS